MWYSRNWKHAAGVAALTLAFVLLGVSTGLAQHYTRTDLTADNSSTSPRLLPSHRQSLGLHRHLIFFGLGKLSINKDVCCGAPECSCLPWLCRAL